MNHKKIANINGSMPTTQVAVESKHYILIQQNGACKPVQAVPSTKANPTAQLKRLQELVFGGYERIGQKSLKGVHVLVNGEGTLPHIRAQFGFCPNPLASAICGQVVLGPALLTKDSRFSYTGFTNAQLQQVWKEINALPNVIGLAACGSDHGKVDAFLRDIQNHAVARTEAWLKQMEARGVQVVRAS